MAALGKVTSVAAADDTPSKVREEKTMAENIALGQQDYRKAYLIRLLYSSVTKPATMLYHKLSLLEDPKNGKIFNLFLLYKQ